MSHCVHREHFNNTHTHTSHTQRPVNQLWIHEHVIHLCLRHPIQLHVAFFQINNTSKMLDEMPVMSNEHHACTCIFWYENIIKLGTKNVAPWTECSIEVTENMKQIFNNTLNRTMENLISKYMSDTAIGSSRASATYDDTIECRDEERDKGRERERGRGCTISESLLWCDSRYVLFGNIPFSCVMQSRTRIHNGKRERMKALDKTFAYWCGLESWIGR